ncbi:MAG: Rab family GTPase [Candidatus Acidiferrales bacterium]
MRQKKICMLGSFSVGKTSLVRRFVESIFDEAYHTTIGVKVDQKQMRADGEDLNLAIWDIFGDDAFQKLPMSYLRGMSGYLLVADGTRRATYEVGVALVEKVTEAMGKVPFVFLLNKCDLADQWEIEPETEKILAGRGWTVMRTSAKTGELVEEAFTDLARAMLAK